MSNSIALQNIPTSNTTNELIVSIRPYNWDMTEYQGTRAQLEAEAVIPEGTDWPDGDTSIKWQAGPFDYDLRRKRPEGMKGPKKVWVEGDWWVLRWEPSNLPPYPEREIKLKAQELADAIYRRSAKGEAERSVMWDCYWKSVHDEKFQAFKALVPGLIRPKRGGGRRSRNAADLDEQKANI